MQHNETICHVWVERVSSEHLVSRSSRTADYLSATAHCCPASTLLHYFTSSPTRSAGYINMSKKTLRGIKVFRGRKMWTALRSITIQPHQMVHPRQHYVGAKHLHKPCLFQCMMKLQM